MGIIYRVQKAEVHVYIYIYMYVFPMLKSQMEKKMDPYIRN